MNKHENCPDCEAKLEWIYEPPYQEYAGAKVWGGSYSAECKCGWYGDTETDLKSYNVRENTRGW